MVAAGPHSDDAPGAARPRTGSIDIIQMLRGIAAFLVVMFHVRWVINGPAFLDLGDRLFANGAAGVDLFFVISGFIMVHVTADSACTNRDVGAFVVKRWSRIWPPYVVATLIYLLCDPDLVFDSQLAIDVGKAFVFYPRNHQSIPFFGHAPLGVGWTLCYEVWFYLLFAASMTFRRYRWVALALFFATLLIALPALLGRPTLNAYTRPRVAFDLLEMLMNPMMWEFAAGAVIAALYRSRFALPAFPAKLAFAAAATWFVWMLLVSGRHGPLHWGIPSAALLLSAVLLHKVCVLRIPRWLVWLGDISFSLYLVHRIVQVAMLRYFPELGLQRWITPGGAYVLASTAFSLIVAAISHRYLEHGVSDWVRRHVSAVLGLAPSKTPATARR